VAELDFSDGTAVIDLNVRWIHGSESPKYNTDPDIQVHRAEEHTYILRQNKAVTFEAPFLFLLFGERKAVLIDTGATTNPAYFPLRETVDHLIDSWLAEHPRPYELLVLHTHSHTDHTSGDDQFTDRPDTTVIGAKKDQAWPYFGFDEDDVKQLDLGGRIVDCLATPGHHEAAVTYYDRYSGILLTGDTVYPGRLYVFDWPAFVRSIDRLVEWTGQHPVSHVLGCHIEMSTTPGMDYPVGWTYQPDETPLELTAGHLGEIQRTLREHGDKPGRYVLPQVIVTPVGEAAAT
jgi:hydroxyacylglutathione hydrolase